jgi:hypothetical protein
MAKSVFPIDRLSIRVLQTCCNDLTNRPFNDLTKLAEGVGFEPTELSLNGFQDRRLKPLGHPSGENGLVF